MIFEIKTDQVKNQLNTKSSRVVFKPKETIVTQANNQQQLISLDVVRGQKIIAQQRVLRHKNLKDVESLLLNSPSFQTIVSQQNYEIINRSPVATQLNSPPIPRTQEEGRTFLRSTFNEEEKSEESPHIGQILNLTKSAGIQNSMEIKYEEFQKESTDLDMIGSRHYQDYINETNDFESNKQIQTEKKPESFQKRHNSVKNPFTSQDYQKLKHDLTIAEISANPHASIGKLMQPFMKDNSSAEKIQDLETQMKKRIMPHTYESLKKQQIHISPSEIKRQAGGIAVRAIVENTKISEKNDEEKKKAEDIFQKRIKAAQVGRVVHAKSKVQIPKDLILMKIAQRQMEMQRNQIITECKQEKQTLLGKRRQSLPPMMTERKFFQLDLNQDSAILEIEQIEPKTTRKPVFLNFMNQNSDVKLQPFHITDLLNQTDSNVHLDYYKRSVKNDLELKIEKEIIIKNYRLRLVDGNKDISAQDRKLMHLNKGTSIYVANSLIKPEIHRYSTQVSDVLGEVFLNNFQKQPQEILQTKEDEITSRLQSNQNQTPMVSQRPEKTPVSQQRILTAALSQQSIPEQEEYFAVIQAQQLVDSWFHCAESQQDILLQKVQNQAYNLVNSNKDRYILQNGQMASLSLQEIQNRMAKPSVAQLLMKPRFIPTEEMTAITQFKDKSYLNLMRSVIDADVKKYCQNFHKKTAKYYDPSTILKTHQESKVQVVDYATQFDASNYMRVEFTLLDEPLIQEQNLSQDLFFEQEPLDNLVRDLKKGQEKIFGKTEFMFVETGGQYELRLIDVEVVGYEPAFRVFNLVNKEEGVVTTRSRFNLQLTTDPDNWIEANRDRIDYWREVSQQYLRVQRIINQEMISRYSDLAMLESTKSNILKKVGEIKKFNRIVVEKVVLQIEALYVFAILKSTLSSQRYDPYIKNMLINFKVDVESPALIIEEQPLKLKGENLHDGILAFRFDAIKNELSKSAISVSNGKYMQLPKLLHQITYESIHKEKFNLFLSPIPAQILIKFGGNKFYRRSEKQINEAVNVYPLEHMNWIQGQAVISEQFQKLLKVKWVNLIAKQIWDFIGDDFEFANDKEFNESQIDPHLLRILAQIKQYQATILYEIFEMGIRQYLRFLLSFCLRDEDIKKSNSVKQIRSSEHLQLIDDDPNKVQLEDQDKNELELIPLQQKPLVNLHAELQITGKMRNRKYKVITVPEIEQINKDFYGVVKNLHEATRQLKRVDAIVFPLLELQQQYITQPDIKHDFKLVSILQLVAQLIDQSCHGCKKKVVHFQSYISIFEKKVDGIILELKKQSFALANEGSEKSDSDTEQVLTSVINSQVVDPEPKQNQKQLRNTSDSSEPEEIEESEDDNQEKGENMMAYKSVEINEKLMKNELESIRKHRFTVMDEVLNQYDFGMLYLDCRQLKKVIIDHCVALEEQISAYVRHEFNEKMKNVNGEISALKGRLDENVSSIDDVIALLNYIDTLKKQDNKVEEIADYIDIMTKNMEQIESLKIIFLDDTTLKFYHLRNWPRTFDFWIQNRKKQLLLQKEQLIKQMQIECEEVLQKVSEFQKSIIYLLSIGLRNVKSDNQKKNEEFLTSLFIALLPENQTGPVPAEIPQDTVFTWLANETMWQHRKFDRDTNIKVFEQIDTIKQKFEDLDRLTIQINKRQTLLGVDKTEFNEQKRLFDELKPVHSLWTVVFNYLDKIAVWFEGPLEKLEFQAFETQIEEWMIEIKRLQKAQIINSNEKQIEMLNFIQDTIAYIRKYTHLIKITRVKGLTNRHWRQINAELSIVIDPSTTTLLRIIGLQLQNEESIQKIKVISDIANKEHQIQMQTEQLNEEMRRQEFLFVNIKHTKVLKNLESILILFNEFMIRVQVVKMNPYMKNFFERLLEIEKTGKNVIEIVTELQNLQDKWIFLHQVFGQELSDQLASECKIWSTVDKFYFQSLKYIIDGPQVVRLLLKESFLLQLKKSNSDIESCRDGLNRFLEKKRSAFPRLYFISNEELLYIYGKEREVINQLQNGQERSFINIIYNGVIKLEFNSKKEIAGIIGNDEEKLELLEPITMKGSIESWLKTLEQELENALKFNIFMAYMDMDRDCPKVPQDFAELRQYKKQEEFKKTKINAEIQKEWIKNWTGQACFVCQQVWFVQKLLVVFQGAIAKSKLVEDDKKYFLRLRRQLKQKHNSDSESDPYLTPEEEDSDEKLEEQQDITLSSFDKSEDPEYEEEKKVEQIVEKSEKSQSGSRQGSAKSQKQNNDLTAKKNRFSIVDRCMRFWDRFQVNEIQHPKENLAEIRHSVVQKIKFMIHDINHKLKKHILNSTVALITCCVYQRDQLQSMIDTKQFKLSDFEWEVQIKFVFDRLPMVFKNVFPEDLDEDENLKSISRLQTQELEIRCDLFNFSKIYGYQYIGNAERIVITPLTLKAQQSILLTLQYQFSPALEGPFGTGKTETVKDIGNMVARQQFVMNASSELSFVEVLKFIKGSCQSGIWLCFDEFNRMSSQMMNIITQIVNQIQTAVRAATHQIYFDDQKVTIDFDSAIFITMNPGYAGRVELPINLKSLFRPIQMVLPDWALITEILLAGAGFYFAFDLSRKMTHVQKLANELMQKHSHVQSDFGLRAIRTIIHIAKSLRRQCLNLQLSEMPDIIYEKSINNVNWKDQKLINEVLQELQGGDSYKKEIFGVQNDIKIEKNVQESKQVQDLFVGPMFQAVFESAYSRSQKQQIALYRQIGIDKNDPNEQEIEEATLIKAIKDYNNAKFNEEDHKIINRIISDIFSHEIEGLQTVTKRKSSKLTGFSHKSSNKLDSNVSKRYDFESKKINIESQSSDYGNLREVIKHKMLQNKLDLNLKLEQKCYQMYEVIQNKTGCILLGQTQSAKSTLMNILAGALNEASHNELKLRVAQKRRERLIQNILGCPQVELLLPPNALKRLSHEIKEAQGRNSHLTKKKVSVEHQEIQNSSPSETSYYNPEKKKKKVKLTEKQKTTLLQDLYAKTKLDLVEIQFLQKELVQRGVQINRINPKQIQSQELIGQYSQKGIWNEGILTKVLRQYYQDTSSLKKWVHLDGPVDHLWAEQLNSLLDENKKLNLPNGDVIQVRSTTVLLFETDSIQNLTPATVSRCGLVHLNRQDVNNPKYILNQYLQRLPPNLADNLKDIENQSNWLLPTCFEVFKQEKEAGQLLIECIDDYWLINSFIKIFDSFMQSFWIFFIGQNKSDWEDAPQQQALKKCLYAYGYNQNEVDLVQELQDDVSKLDPEKLEKQFNSMKIASLTPDQDKDKRNAYNDFIQNENRQENSLKYLPIWIEAFLITSITMTFGPVLNKQARDRLALLLQNKYMQCKSDFSTYQKAKRKLQMAREEQKKKDAKAILRQLTSMINNKKEQNTKLDITQQTQFLGTISSQLGQTQNSIESIKTQDKLKLLFGITADFTQKFEEASSDDKKPMFISDFPFENTLCLNIFDFYFNLDNSQWMRFDDTNLQFRMMQIYQQKHQAQQSVNSLVVPTIQLVKQFYFMECLTMAQKPILVAGKGATGKSTLIKNFLFTQMSQFTKNVYADHLTCTYRTNNNSLKNLILNKLQTIDLKVKGDYNESDTERPLESPKHSNSNKSDQSKEKTKETNKEPKRMRPHIDGVSILVYIEDLHLSNFDSFSDNSAVESIRDLIQYQTWYSTKKEQMRKIENVNMIVCANINNSNFSKISQRCLKNLSIVGVEPLNDTLCFKIVNRMLGIHATQWPNSSQDKVSNIAKAIFDLQNSCLQYLRPTPTKVQYTFNQREIFKLVSAICKVESNYMKNQENICRLFFHEALRQYADRILIKNDLKKFLITLKSICCENFLGKKIVNYEEMTGQEQEKLFADFPVQDSDNIWFSILNNEVEGYYLELSDPKKIKDIIQRQIERYNEQPEIRKLNLILFDEMYRHLFKIIRAISLHSGHLIVVGLRGFAIGELIKLSSFITQKKYCEMDIHPDYSDFHWQAELKQKIIETAQNDKQICFVIEEHKIINPDWFRDIEALMSCNITTSIFNENELLSILTQIKLQQARINRQMISQIQTNLDIQGIQALESEINEKVKISIANIIKENMLEFQRDPCLSNELYQLLLKRTSQNLHIVMSFSPSGQNFRTKMQDHSQLMYNSQIIWIQQMTGEDLQQMGEQIFLDEMETELLKNLMQDSGRDSRLDSHVKTSERKKNTRILKSLIQVYLITLKFSKKYQEKNHHTLYFTPVFFLRSLTAYKRLLNDRERQVKDIKNRYNKGLEKIKNTIAAVQQYKKELEVQTPILIKNSEKVIAMMTAINAEIQNLVLQKQSDVADQKQIIADTSAAKINLDNCQYALDSIVPALNNSLQEMNQINKVEIAEIKSMQHPPRTVKLVMKCICILMDIQPVLKQTKNGKNKLSYWRAVISSALLGDNFLSENLAKFDRTKLTEEKMQIIEGIMQDPDFSLNSIYKSTVAAKNFYAWVKAIRDYHYIFKELEPRKNALINAEKIYEMAKEISFQQSNKISGLEENIQNLSSLLAEKTKYFDDLKFEIEDKTLRNRRSELLLRSLSTENQKWVVCSRLLNGSESSINSDVVLATSIINYGGGFTYSYRRQLIEKWQEKALKPNGLTITDNFQLQELFGDNFKIRDWHQNGLLKDLLSTDNALIMEKTKQYVTCIDPQHQASIWLRKQHEKAGIMVQRQQDPGLKKILEIAIDLGKIVIVENLTEKVDVTIESLVRQEITKHQDSRMIKFCRKQLKLDSGFRLFLLTPIPKPHFDVNFTNYTTLVNFFTTIEGLSSNLLSLVVANERSELEENFNNALDKTFYSVKQLKEVENSLLDKLESQVPIELLADEVCIEFLRDSAKLQEEISYNIRKIKQYSEMQENARSLYSPIAFRAATIYLAIQEMQYINPMYRFGVSWFINQFNSILSMVSQVTQLKNAKTDTKVSINDDEFLLKDVSTSPEHRIDLILSTFTQELIRKITFSVFQRDRRFITYYLTLKILQAEQLTDDNLISFLLAGSKIVTEPEERFKQVNKLDWLSDVVWSDLKFLETQKPFNQENLTNHILDNQSQWQRLYESDHFEFTELPNHELINLDQFKVIEIKDAIEAADQKMKITFSEGFVSQTNQTKVEKKKKVKKYTEKEILNDASIWQVSDEEELQEYKKLTIEEKDMAKYLTDRAAGAIKDRGDYKIKMTKKEQSNYQLRMNVIRKTIELVLAKVIRPDLIELCLHSLVGIIYNYNYDSFNFDVLSKFIDQDGTLTLRKRIPLTLRKNPAPLTQINMPQRQKRENNIQLLIDEAFLESKPAIPIMLLITENINVFNNLLTYLQSFTATGQKIQQIYLGKINEAQQLIIIKTAMVNGDWILIQNLHLQPSYFAFIEQIILSVKDDSTVNPKFRLWFSSSQIDNFNVFILKQCIKVALEQPENIKIKMEKQVEKLKMNLFKRGNDEQGNMHKNMYLGLCYLHGVLQGRGAYGSFGWNIPYEFDNNDFEISDQILALFQKKELKEKFETLDQLKFIFTNINFAGKISIPEDHRKLQAHIDDLFDVELVFQAVIPIQLDNSHFGFPNKDHDILEHIKKELPDQDHYQIFGFNQNIHRFKEQKAGFKMLSNMKKMSQKTLKERGYADIHTDLENQLKIFSLERLGTSIIVEKPDSLIHCFIKLQQYLARSSLDQTITDDTDRYDDSINSLSQRDFNDKQVSSTIKQIKLLLINLLLASPARPSQFQAVWYILEKEINFYKKLIFVMIETLNQFLISIEGDAVIDPQTEKLWLMIQNNQIPQSWIEASYETAHVLLSHYLLDFVDKVNFWNKLISKGLNSHAYKISAFYQPRDFLQAVLSDFSNLSEIQIINAQNQFKILQIMEPPKENLDVNQRKIYLFGLWLQGADWDNQEQILVEQKSTNLQIKFPVIELTQIKSNLKIIYDEEYSYFNDNPTQSKKQQLSAEKQKEYIYRCPVFATSNRLSNTNQKAYFYINMKSYEKPRKWVKRSVALLMEPQILK